MKTAKIPLKSIILEDQFRDNLENKSLANSIDENGLQEPLTVEGPTHDGKYYLKYGYRRYANLEKLRHSHAECKVEKLTDEYTRILDRLHLDLQTSRKTGFAVEKMLETLLDKDYTLEKISNKINIPSYKLKRYIKILDVDSNLRKEAEKAKVGREGLTRLWNLKYILQEYKYKLIKKYMNKEISGYHAQCILHLEKIEEFKELPHDFKEQCINETISKCKFHQPQAERIVKTKSLQNEYDPVLHDYMYEEIKRDIQQLKKDISPNFIENLEPRQKKELSKLLGSLIKNQLKKNAASPRKKENAPFILKK